VSATRRVSSGSPYEPVIGFSRAVRSGDRILVSGTAPVWPDGSCDPDPAAQTRRCLAIILAALKDLGAGPEHVVRTRILLTRAEDWEAVGRAHGEVVYLTRLAALRAARSSRLPQLSRLSPLESSWTASLPSSTRK